MRLVQVIITNFRSIESLTLELDPCVTTLIGKNDSGKTNLLRALYSIDDEYKFDVGDLPYGSSLRNKYDAKSPSPADVVTFVADFGETDTKNASPFVKELVRRNPRLTMTKCLDNRYRIESALETARNVIGQLFREGVCAMVSDFDTIISERSGATRWYRKIWAPQRIDEGITRIAEVMATKLEQDVDLRIDQTTEIRNAIRKWSTEFRKLGQLAPVLRPEYAFGSEIVSKLRFGVERIARPGPLAGSTSMEELENLEAGSVLDRVVCLTNLDKGVFTRTQDPMAYRDVLQEANTRLNTLLGPLVPILGIGGIRLELIGRELRMFALEQDGTQTLVDEKSDGCQYLISLYLDLLYQAVIRPGAILLLDEPGMHLHPDWQRKLRDLIEEISKNHQVVLATHCPCMVDPARLDRVRLVSREGSPERTVVKQKFYVSDFDALEPIRAALGVHISDSLFVGAKILLVEGIEDYYIIHGMSELCRRVGREHLSPLEVFVLPNGGAGSIEYFGVIACRLAEACLVLLDSDRAGQNARKKLQDRWNFTGTILLTGDVDPGAVTLACLLPAEFYDRVHKECREDKVKTAKEICRIARDEPEAVTIVGERGLANFSHLFDLVNAALSPPA